jgi:hypothetical protein
MRLAELTCDCSELYHVYAHVVSAKAYAEASQSRAVRRLACLVHLRIIRHGLKQAMGRNSGSRKVLTRTRRVVEKAIPSNMPYCCMHQE